MTAPTTAGGAVLPVVAGLDGTGEPWDPAIALTPRAATQAEIDALRAELQAMTDDRDSWCAQASARTEDAVRFAAERDALRAENERLKSEMQERALQALCDDGQWTEETGRLNAELYACRINLLATQSDYAAALQELAALKAALNPPANTPPTGVFVQAVQAAQDDKARDAGRLDWVRDTFFNHKWNGVIGPGYRTNWSIVPHYRHIRLHDETGNAAGDFRAAIDAAIAATKETP